MYHMTLQKNLSLDRTVVKKKTFFFTFLLHSLLILNLQISEFKATLFFIHRDKVHVKSMVRCLCVIFNNEMIQFTFILVFAAAILSSTSNLGAAASRYHLES